MINNSLQGILEWHSLPEEGCPWRQVNNSLAENLQDHARKYAKAIQDGDYDYSDFIMDDLAEIAHEIEIVADTEGLMNVIYKLVDAYSSAHHEVQGALDYAVEQGILNRNE